MDCSWTAAGRPLDSSVNEDGDRRTRCMCPIKVPAASETDPGWLLPDFVDLRLTDQHFSLGSSRVPHISVSVCVIGMSDEVDFHRCLCLIHRPLISCA